jgi:hypothetical protein
LIVLLGVVGALVGPAPHAQAATFNPALVISDANMRASATLSTGDIQSFLNTQKGPLKSLVTTDYAGKKKPASQIIYEASVQWHINPRVMLTLLQKEQSLLTRTSLDKNTLSRAIGAGCPNGSTNKYPGFGNQMWYGARLLDGYGEGKNGSTIALWKAPTTTVMDIYKHPNVVVKTANLATYKLYIYNPSIGAKSPYGDLSSQASNLSGNANFWMIYRKSFGDTFAAPPGYHTHARISRATQLWNSTIHTKRSPSPKSGGFVSVTGPIIVRHRLRYIQISWGGRSGWVRYDHIRWV